jgi:hypothetical protein
MSKDIYTLIEKYSSIDISQYLPEESDLEYVHVDYDDIDEHVTDEVRTSWGAPKGELNIFYGGEIQRKAHSEGRHKHYKSEAGKKSWKNRCKKTATDKMVAGYKKILATPEGWQKHIERSKKGAQAARLALLKKIMYNGKIYYGWDDLKNQTGISKYKFVKYNLGDIL